MDEHKYTIWHYAGTIFPMEVLTRREASAVRAAGGVILYGKCDEIRIIVYALKNPKGKYGKRKIGGYKIYVPTKTEMDIINQFIVQRIMQE